MIDSENTVHVAGRDRVKRCEVFWMSSLLEALPDGTQRRIRTTEPTRGADCDRRTVGNQRGSSFQGDEFGSGHLGGSGWWLVKVLVLNRYASSGLG